MPPPPGAIWYQTTCNISFFWAPYVIEYIIKLSMTTNNRERKVPWTMDLINPAKIWMKLLWGFGHTILIFQKLRGDMNDTEVEEGRVDWTSGWRMGQKERGWLKRDKLKQYHGLYSQFRGSPRGLDDVIWWSNYKRLLKDENVWFRRGVKVIYKPVNSHKNSQEREFPLSSGQSMMFVMIKL